MERETVVVSVQLTLQRLLSNVLTLSISHFDVGSTIKIVIFRRSLLAGRLSLKKYFVAKYTGRGIDLLANGNALAGLERL